MKYEVYEKMMNESCDKIIDGTNIMQDESIPLAKRIELRDQLWEAGVKIKEMALELAKQGIEHTLPSE